MDTPRPLGAAGTTDNHQAVIERLIAAINSGQLDELDAFIVPNHVFHTCGFPEPFVGREALKALLAQEQVLQSSVPYVLETVLASGEQVAARWKRQGPSLDMETMEPTTGTTTVDGQFICRFDGGQVIETWNVSYVHNSDDDDDES